MTYEVYLAHHGVKGQKWGIRRYQNEDGSYTDIGKKKYAKASEDPVKKFLSVQAKDAEKYKTSKAQEWAEYLWRKNPFRKDYY